MREEKEEPRERERIEKNICFRKKIFSYFGVNDCDKSSIHVCEYR